MKCWTTKYWISSLFLQKSDVSFESSLHDDVLPMFILFYVPTKEYQDHLVQLSEAKSFCFCFCFCWLPKFTGGFLDLLQRFQFFTFVRFFKSRPLPNCVNGMVILKMWKIIVLFVLCNVSVLFDNNCNVFACRFSTFFQFVNVEKVWSVLRKLHIFRKKSALCLCIQHKN